MKQLRVSLAAALVLTGLVLTSILHSETRRLTAQENAAIGACASRYYVCNGHCQNSATVEARANCEAECLRAYNACFSAAVRPLPLTDLRVAPSPSAVAPATPTPMPRNISPPRVTGVATATKPQSTIAAQGAPRGVVSQPTVAPPPPTPRPLNYARRPIGGVYRTHPAPTISPTPSPASPTPVAARRLTKASPTPSPQPTRRYN